MSDSVSREVEHNLTREGKATYYNIYELSPESNGELILTDVEQRGPCETKKTYRCSCGRSFYKEEIAAEHLRSVGKEPQERQGETA